MRLVPTPKILIGSAGAFCSRFERRAHAASRGATDLVSGSFALAFAVSLRRRWTREPAGR